MTAKSSQKVQLKKAITAFKKYNFKNFWKVYLSIKMKLILQKKKLKHKGLSIN